MKNDTIKVGQILKVSKSIEVLTPTSLSSSPNWIIAKSESVLGGHDSSSSVGRKLPAKFSSREGTLYTLSKKQLLSEFVDLIEWTSMGEAEVFTRELVHKFSVNTSYDINNTYTHPKLVELVRKSDSFKNTFLTFLR